VYMQREREKEGLREEGNQTKKKKATKKRMNELINEYRID
jgi:hypothetical protein